MRKFKVPNLIPSEPDKLYTLHDFPIYFTMSDEQFDMIADLPVGVEITVDGYKVVRVE